MNEEKKSSPYWLPVLVAIIPITVGVFQYHSTRQTEFRKHVWDEQMALYKQVADIASEIAMAPSLEAAAPARKAFWGLYWGKLTVFKTKEVEHAMKSFGERLGNRCRYRQYNQ